MKIGKTRNILLCALLALVLTAFFALAGCNKKTEEGDKGGKSPEVAQSAGNEGASTVPNTSVSAIPGQPSPSPKSKAQLQLDEAEKLTRGNKMQEAADIYKEMLKEDPKNTDARVRLGATYNLMAAFQGRRELLPDAEKELEQAIKEKPAVRANFMLGMTYELEGTPESLEKAVEIQKKVSDMKPGEESDKRIIMAASKKIDNLVALKKKLEELESKAKENPDKAQSYVEMAKLFSANPAMAELNYKKALENDPNSSEGHLGMGSIYFGRYMFLKSAYMADGTMPPVTGGDVKAKIKAMVEERQKREQAFVKEHPEEIKAALGEAKKAIELQPKLGDAYLLMGAIQEEMKDNDAALKTFEEYLKVAGDSNPKAAQAVKQRIEELKGGKKPMIEMEEIKKPKAK